MIKSVVSVDLVTLIEEILNGKFHFLRSVDDSNYSETIKDFDNS